jgi:hypothetical protein
LDTVVAELMTAAALVNHWARDELLGDRGGAEDRWWVTKNLLKAGAVDVYESKGDYRCQSVLGDVT